MFSCFSLFPVIADIVLQDLERKILEIIKNDLLFYVRYIDNIALDLWQIIFQFLIFFHSRLQFIVEISVDKLGQIF